MRLSFARVDAYRRCPYQYRLAWVERIPPPSRPYTKLANALHLSLAVIHRPGSEAPAVDAALEHYCRAWAGFGAITAYDREQHSAGEEILRRYLADASEEWPRTLYVETPFEVQLGPHTLFGRLDRVDETPAGLEVVDYKTAEVPMLPPDTLQLDVYCLGLEALIGRLPAVVSFYYLRSHTKRSFARTRLDADGTRAELEELARRLEADWRLEPKVGPACRSCPYQAYCPAVTEEPRPIPDRGPGQLRLEF